MIIKQRTVTFEEGLFKDLFLQFIEYKQGLGFNYGDTAQSCLSRLNTQLNTFQTDEPVLSKVLVEKLASRHGSEAPATQIKRICYLRHFAEFLQDMGYEAYIYPAHCSVVFHDSFSPYIFSHQQIKSIIMAADSIAFTIRSPMHYLVWSAFVRVLYCCGLRLSEALNLKTQDVDLESGILYIEKSKNGTSRYVPMAFSLNDYLRRYAENMDIDMNNHKYFFPAPDNGRYAINTARDRIKKFFVQAEIPRLSSGRYPRVHDIRHSFSCHALEMMQKKGFDLYYSIPILSAYLGHQGIRDTEKYLRLPAFQYQSITDMQSPLLDGIIPEVSSYE